MGEEGLPWLGCWGVPSVGVPVLAYWYDGGRPSGCCGGFIVGREAVEEAAGLVLVLGLLAAAAVFTVGMELCDCEEVILLAADEAVPLVVGAAVFELCGERFAVELLDTGVVLLEDLLVEPASLARKFFIEVDMET